MAPPLGSAPTRVLLLTQWFEPEPTFKGLSFARALKGRGMDVEVVTGFPNYPGGKVYSGYRIRPMQRELIDGICVTRLPLYPSHDNSALRRVVNYISFAAAASAYGLLCWRRPQVIYAYHPPLTVGVSAALVGILRRVPVVLDVQDMWPDTLRATGMISSSLVLGIIGRVCGWVYRRVDRIVVLSEGFRHLLIDRGVSANKVEVIPNWAEEVALATPSGSPPPAFPGPERFRILFAGNMGKAQGLTAVLDAAHRLSKIAPEIVFVFMGGGVEAEYLRQQALSRGLENVMFLAPVPMGEVGCALREADALLVHLKRDPLFAITIPSKTQAYMAVGKPVLMAVDGDAAELVTAARCGVLARSEDASSLADAALCLFKLPAEQRTELGENGRRYYQERLSLDAGSARFASLFESLIRKKPRNTAAAK